MGSPRIIWKTIPGFARRAWDCRLWKLAAVGWCLLCPALPSARSDDAAAAPPGAEKYLLRYRFQPGEVLCWNVVHGCQIRTVAAGGKQTADTATASVKVWRVQTVRPDGTATLEHLVKDIDMRHRLTGRDEVHYNSRTDLHAPPGFEDIARAVGVPLCTVTIDAQGKVLARQQNPVKASVPGHGDITIRLPKEPIAVGQSWSFPSDIELPLCAGRRATDRGPAELHAPERQDGGGGDPHGDPDPDSRARPGPPIAVVAVRSRRHGAVGHRGRTAAGPADRTSTRAWWGSAARPAAFTIAAARTEEFLPPEAKVAARAAAGSQGRTQQ